MPTSSKPYKKHTEPLNDNLNKSKLFGSAPSLLVENKDALSKIQHENELVFKFSKQLDYLLNPKERNEIKSALKIYNHER